MKLNKRIFNSAEDVKEAYGIDVNIPDDLPEGCNIIGYEYNDLSIIDFYKETSDELLWLYQGVWKPTGSLSLCGEVADDISNEHEYVYLRLTQQYNKEKFTPKRLLGVETDYGYVTTVITADWFSEYIKSSYYVYTTESLSKEDLRDVHSLKFYISDESDETVPFDEYLDMFYERE